MTSDPIEKARESLLAFVQGEDMEPMVALAAMVQVAAKISHDSGIQDGLTESQNKHRWMGGVMLAYDAVVGGKIFGEPGTQQSAAPPEKKRKFGVLCGGAGHGMKKGFNFRKNKEKNKAARDSRRRNRGK